MLSAFTPIIIIIRKIINTQNIKAVIHTNNNNKKKNNKYAEY